MLIAKINITTPDGELIDQVEVFDTDIKSIEWRWVQQKVNDAVVIANRKAQASAR